MANQTRFGALQRLIGGLEVGLASLVEKTAQQTGRSKEEIELALEDLGFLASAPEPEDYDPYDKLRRAAMHIRRLRKVLSEEEKRL
jgi:hypothetical protein